MCAIMNTILILYVGVQADVELDPRIMEIRETAAKSVNDEFENACERHMNKVSPMIMQRVIHTHACVRGFVGLTVYMCLIGG